MTTVLQIKLFGKEIIAVKVGSLFVESLKGWKASEEKLLQYNLYSEKRLEEEKKIEYEKEIIRQGSEYKKCCCQEIKKSEEIMESAFCFCDNIFFRYIHWLKEQWTSSEVKKEELKTLIENVRTILKIVEDTYQHEKVEWELNNSKATSENEDYEIIDKGIVELEQETAEWQNVLVELKNKLDNFQIGEQQAQILQVNTLLKRNN